MSHLDEPGDLAAFRDVARRFIEREIAPHHAAWEAEGVVPRSLWRKAGEAGLLCPSIPMEYGGGGGDFRHSAIVTEELARGVYGGPGFRVHSDVVAFYLLHHAPEAMKQRWLPAMGTGEAVGAIAMTEPGAGSDLQGITTTAVRDGDDYVISGSKTFISNGGTADFVIVAAKTDKDAGAKGISLILVEADRAGFSRGRNLPKMGMKAQDTAELFFDDVRVPVDNLIGAEGRGFACLMAELPQERLIIAVNAVATSEVVLAETVEHVKRRKMFGKTLGDMQHARFRLAEQKAYLDMARALLDRCLAEHLEGRLSIPSAASVKYATTEVEAKIVDLAVQLHGGMGYMTETLVARAYLDARVHRIYGGSSETMLELIARGL